MAFTWTKDLETGYALIDNEHKQLLKAADDLITACSLGKGRQELGTAVEFLSNYTKTHFSHEEELQAKHRFPDYTTHKSWHQAYVKNIETVLNRLKVEGPTITLVGAVNSEVSQLILHIKTADLKLAKFIQNSSN